MLTLDLQLYAVLVMFLTGVSLGLVFDIYRGVRSALNPGPVATGIGDVLFWVVGTMILGAALLFGTWGEIRLFVPIGIAAGLAVYRALTGRTVARVTRRLLRLVARTLHAVAGLLREVVTSTLVMLVALLRVLIWPLQLVARMFARPGRWIKRQLGRLLAPFARLRKRLAEAIRAWRDGPSDPPPEP